MATDQINRNMKVLVVVIRHYLMLHSTYNSRDQHIRVKRTTESCTS